jgi:hypothetical protein
MGSFGEERRWKVMERFRSNGLILLVVGAAVALISAFAYEIGIGDKPFGWAQQLGTLLGCLAIIAGVYLAKFEAKYVAAAGIALAILFLGWDKIGLGEPGSGFGPAHTLALITAVAVACLGLYSMRKVA